MRTFLVALLLILSTGCGPSYRTLYHFEPPASLNGKRCANECLYKTQECSHQCTHNRYQCEQGAKMAELAHTVVDALATQNKQPYYNSHNGSYHQCVSQENQCIESCKSMHRICHQNCGGDVRSETVCIRNCPH